MAFSSVFFLVYFLPAVLVAYHFCPPRFKNPLLLIASIFFYSWGAPRFIFVILGTTFIDFFLVKSMDSAKTQVIRRVLLILSLSVNLGLLFYFKYCDFFISQINVLLSGSSTEPIGLLKIVLPIGISFYTFESVTYVVDVYRRVHKPLTDFWRYQLYILFFPKLIAGPIVRYHEIADQLGDRSAEETAANRLNGFIRFAVGLAKKVLLANTMAEYADAVFESPVEKLSSIAVWCGVVSYTFQIYFDFSGYSDMAIGLARMFGFRIPENFDNPYVSRSITEFWRRWHITLGNWMKNYLYIPLGGNRVNSNKRVYFNLLIVFIASGLWHGAGYTFLLWGLYHGFFLVLERLFLLKLYKRLPDLFAMGITFFLVMLGWLVFRADSPQQCLMFLRKMFSWTSEPWYSELSLHFYFYLACCLLFAFWILLPFGKHTQDIVFNGARRPSSIMAYGAMACVILLVSLATIASSEFNPFIYFRF